VTGLEAAWLAGIIEGEASMQARPHDAGRRPTLAVCISMTDEDVVRFAAGLMGVRANGPYKRAGRDHQVFYVAQAYGAKAEAVMRTVLPFMFERRAAKIRECLNTPNLSHTPRG